MKFGIVASSGSPAQVLEMARAAEEAGWDGFFTWDGISVGPMDTFDPWTLLGAVAATTQTIRLGAIVFSLPRRKPWEVARQTLTLDHLAGGRLILPVGLGAVDDGAYSRVSGGTTDVRVRAELLDDMLTFLDLAWTGEPVTFDGAHHWAHDLVFQPRPVQTPIPVWVVAVWPGEKSMRRAVLREGVLPSRRGDPFNALTPPEIAEIAAWFREQRPRDAGPIDLVLEGVLPEDRSAAREYAQARADVGATWWIESRWDGPGATPGALLEHIRQGPVGVRGSR